MSAFNNFIIIASILGLSACSSGPSAKYEPILERNIMPVSITEVPRCEKVKLVREADGGLWIK